MVRRPLALGPLLLASPDPGPPLKANEPPMEMLSFNVLLEKMGLTTFSSLE